MISYTKRVTVSKADLDDLGHVNNVRYVEWIQEISKQHWQSVVNGDEIAAYIWVVRNHNITYYSPALSGDVLELTTQIRSSKGALSIRQVEMINLVTKELVVKSETAWCLLHPETLQPTRIPAEIHKLFIL